jgi:tetratricopeptide (TPR) repeat protein
MEDQWTPRLSEYLDEELEPAERSACEAHLASCLECQRLLSDLRRVVARARSLSDAPPAADLWSGVEAQIGPRKVVRFQRTFRLNFSLTFPQIAVAVLVLAAVSVAITWLALARDRAEPPAVASGGTGGPIAIARVGFADASYDRAIADLERALAEGRASLDPATAATIERSLQAIDRAIAEARQALEADPGNVYLNGYFAATRRRKLDLLRQASALARIES